MTAGHREVRAYGSGAVDTPLVARAARCCRFKVLSDQGAVVRLSAGLSFWSFGEQIEVALLPFEGGSVIDVSSRCRWALQIEDWGKNKRNVRRLLAEIDAQLQGAADWEPVALCRKCDHLLLGTTSDRCPECGEACSPATARPSGGKPSFRVGVVLALGLTAMEICVELVLEYTRLPNPLSYVCAGPLGYLWLLAVNLVVVTLIIAAGRVVRWARR